MLVVQNEKKKCRIPRWKLIKFSNYERYNVGLAQEQNIKNKIITHIVANTSCALISAQISNGDKNEAIVTCS